PPLAQEAHRETGALLARQHRAEGHEHSSAVAGHAVRSPRSSMADRGEACECAIEKLPRGAALQVGHEADATRTAFASGVVEEASRFGHCASRFSSRRYETSRRLLLS